MLEALKPGDLPDHVVVQTKGLKIWVVFDVGYMLDLVRAEIRGLQARPETSIPTIPAIPFSTFRRAILQYLRGTCASGWMGAEGG